MDDLISRQAAIDMITTEGTRLERNGMVAMVEIKQWCVDLLESLPSVQPDGIPLEWIDKHLEWLDNCDNDFAQLAKVGIRAMVELWKKDKT